MEPAAGKSNYDQSGSSKSGEDAWPGIIIVQLPKLVDVMPADVRFGSKADIAAFPNNVRFTPESGH